MPTRTAACLVAVLSVAVLSGCVYYNTVYHAKAAAREAELLRESRPPDSGPSRREIELLDRVIEKSGRVLRLHPDSEWADDALLLMASALYYQEKYESAADRLTEFMTLYPTSDLRPDAEYLLAATLLETDSPIAAEEILRDLAYADPPGPLSDDALMLLGRARRDRGRYDEAAEAFAEALERFPKSDRRAEIHYLAAENYVEMGHPEEAIAHFAAVAEEKGGRSLAFDARIRLAETDLELGDTSSALAVLADLEHRTTDRNDLDRVELLTGRVYEAVGDLDEAISTYEEIAASHDRSPAAAEACYRIGIIRRDRLGRLDDAVESFEEAKRNAPKSDIAALANQAIADVEALKEYLAVIEQSHDDISREGSPDSLAFDGAAVSDSVGISLSSDVSGTVAAGAAARSAATRGDEAPEDGFGSVALPDTARGRSEDELALARFRVAELYLFEFGNPDVALEYYASVVSDHPGSALAAKAALAIAWVLEHESHDREGAVRAYRDVVERYRGTECAAAALDALARLGGAGDGDERLGEQDVGEPGGTPESGGTASGDTTGASANGRLPKP